MSTLSSELSAPPMAMGPSSPLAGFDLRPRPVEPWHQGFEIAALDRGTAPDAKARRRRAIGADVEGDALFLEQRGDLLCDVGLRVFALLLEPGIDDLEADAGVRARALLLGEEIGPAAFAHPTRDDAEIRVGAAHEAFQTADAFGPGQRVEIVFERKHRGRVDRL